MEGMERCEDFFQVIQASAMQITLLTIASETEIYPKRPEKSRAAGLKMKATTRKAIVVVYPVPVDFCCVSNIATPSVRGWPKKNGDQIA
jgi:hypothetical protein